METKCCTKCNKELPLNAFGKQKGGFLGLRGACKECRNSDNREFYYKTLDYQRAKGKRYRENNKEKIAEYNELRKEEQKIYNKSYYKKNKEKIIKQTSSYYKRRYHADPIFRLKAMERCRINNALRNKGFKKTSKMARNVGCSYEELKFHLESQFREGMTWENQGKWHVDHIIPLDSAETVQEIYDLCHFSNLQPLWAEENYAKGTKILK